VKRPNGAKRPGWLPRRYGCANQRCESVGVRDAWQRVIVVGDGEGAEMAGEAIQISRQVARRHFNWSSLFGSLLFHCNIYAQFIFDQKDSDNQIIGQVRLWTWLFQLKLLQMRFAH
jgi:hypothetical protein